MRLLTVPTLLILLLYSTPMQGQRYTGSDGRVRVALVKQPFSPTGTSVGPNTMANGGIQQILGELGAVVRIEETALTADEATEYGGWKKLGMALGHFADIVARNEREGYFTLARLVGYKSFNAGFSCRLAALRTNARTDQDLFEAIFR